VKILPLVIGIVGLGLLGAGHLVPALNVLNFVGTLAVGAVIALLSVRLASRPPA